MDWTLCLLCALISMTSTVCYHQDNTPSYDQYHRTETNHDRYDPVEGTSEHSQSQGKTIWDEARQRLSGSKQAQSASNWSEQAQSTNEWSEQAQSKSEWRDQGTDLESSGSEGDQAVQRMSERSLPLHSGRQRLEDIQRRFNHDEEGLRIVNGNKNSGFHLTPRRGVIPDPVVSPDVVVFPGPSRRATPFVPSIPEECLRTGICEELPDYPEDRVATIIEKLGNATEKYKVDELDTFEIAQRIGSPEEMELCDFSLKVAVPKAAPDKDGKWHYILNQKDKPLQGFHVEICKKAGSACSKVAYFYSGYEASCKQKFMLRYMAGLNDNGEVVEKQFKLPSCCSCVVRQID